MGSKSGRRRRRKSSQKRAAKKRQQQGQNRSGLLGWLDTRPKQLAAIAGGIAALITAGYGVYRFWNSLWGTPHVTKAEVAPSFQFPVVLASFAGDHPEFPASSALLARHGKRQGLVFTLSLGVSAGRLSHCSLRWTARDPNSNFHELSLPSWSPVQESLHPCSQDGDREIWVSMPKPSGFDKVVYWFDVVGDGRHILRRAPSATITVGGG